jgi:hypothetical protein
MNRPPQKRKSLTGVTREAPPIHTTIALENNRIGIVAGSSAERKRSVALCRRQLAAAGATLVELDGGRFMVCCGGFSRHCGELSDVQLLIRNARAG